MSRSSGIRRILVALDNSPASLAAAAAAAELAAALEAELAGLFVEEPHLLALARLPLARRFDPLTATTSSFDGEEPERQLRFAAERARQTLARLARERGAARVSFRTSRGGVPEEIRAQAGESDLVSIGRTGWSLGGRRRLGSTVHGLLAACLSPALLLATSVPLGPPVVLLFDGSEAAPAAAWLAATLASRWTAPLTVVLVGDEPGTLREAALDELSGRRGPAALFIASRGHDPERLAAAVADRATGLAVVPVGGPRLGEPLLARLLARVDCPVLVVRPVPREASG